MRDKPCLLRVLSRISLPLHPGYGTAALAVIIVSA